MTPQTKCDIFMKGEFFMEKQKEQRYRVGYMIKGTINNSQITFFALENIDKIIIKK